MKSHAKIFGMILIYILLIFISSETMGQEAEKAAPCASPAASQFDFWVGEWDLTWADSGRGTNIVTKDLGGCVIMEHFDGTPSISLKGISVSVYDEKIGKWRQTWVDNNGAYLDFSGGMVDSAMVLSRDAEVDGEKFKQRMIFYNISRDEFDWDWMRSTDDGHTWESLWEIHYRRRK